MGNAHRATLQGLDVSGRAATLLESFCASDVLRPVAYLVENQMYFQQGSQIT